MSQFLISVKASPSTTDSKTFTFNPSHHGFTQKEWDKLPYHEKEDQVKQFLESIPEQPYWELDSFNQK